MNTKKLILFFLILSGCASTSDIPSTPKINIEGNSLYVHKFKGLNFLYGALKIDTSDIDKNIENTIEELNCKLKNELELKQKYGLFQLKEEVELSESTIELIPSFISAELISDTLFSKIEIKTIQNNRRYAIDTIETKNKVVLPKDPSYKYFANIILLSLRKRFDFSKISGLFIPTRKK